MYFNIQLEQPHALYLVNNSEEGKCGKYNIYIKRNLINFLQYKCIRNVPQMCYVLFLIYIYTYLLPYQPVYVYMQMCFCDSVFYIRLNKLNNCIE